MRDVFSHMTSAVASDLTQPAQAVMDAHQPDLLSSILGSHLLTMSGLEPLAALGLACNVLQVISFTGEVLAISKRVFDTGETPETTASLTKSLDSLTATCRDIDSSVRSTPHPLTSGDRKLIAIANDCKKAALDLKAEIDKSTSAAATRGRVFRSMEVAFKSVLGPSRNVEKLERLFKAHQTTLKTQLLAKKDT